jgi:predicted nucleic acid-binding protein
MRFWDASALLPLLIEEDRTETTKALYDEDPLQAVWCLTEVEVASALARRSREGLPPAGVENARLQLKWLADRWAETSSLPLVRARALRVVNTHSLRAADALQLSAALVASDDRPDALAFVCLDDRLRDAARREGFSVLPP